MSNVKNYKEQGGNKWVIGGEFEVLEGAKLTLYGSELKPAIGLVESTATTIADLKEDFNYLLVALYETGVLAADRTELLEAIDSAEILLLEAVIGEAEGECPEVDFDVFSNAVEAAQLVLDNKVATQKEVNDAKGQLETAILTFQAAVILE